MGEGGSDLYMDLVQLHHARRMVTLHGTCGCHVAILSATWHLRQILLDSHVYTVFWPYFRGSFWKSSGAQNGSCSVSLKILRSLISNDINFVWIRVRTEKLWLLEVRSSELFFPNFPVKIPANREMLLANRELHLIAGVVFFLEGLSLWINSERVGRNLHAEATVQEEKRIRFSTHFPYFRQFLHLWLT